MADPIHLLLAENVQRAEGGDFERLCNYLLELEVNRRHIGGKVDGHPPKYVTDGGIDILVTINNRPRITASDFPKAMTPDRPCELAVSCKTGNQWKYLLKKDAKKESFTSVIKQGGYALLMVHHQVGAVAKKKFMEDFLGSLESSTKLPRKVFAERISFYDANDIAEFYAYRPIRLDEHLRKVLAILDFPGLDSLEVWAAQQRQLRGDPEWIPDRTRTDALDAVRSLVRRPPDGRPEVIWLSGSPGVGKSRLVREALAVDDISQRVLAASDFQYGYEAVFAGDVPRLGDGILVVDECSPTEASGLAATFAGRARGQSSTLILVGPPRRSEQVQFQGLELSLEPMDPGAERTLIERELGFPADESLVSRIVHLTEGFPWFAVLVSEALRGDPEALPETATQWEAASLAIAGRIKDYDNALTHSHEALLRAKALLAIMMTEGEAWSNLTKEQEENLALALEASWSDIKDAALRCFDRGLVRERQNWRYKYVTPLNVGRLAATRLLAAPYFIGSRIRTHVPERRDYLYRRLRDAEMRPFDLETLAAQDVSFFSEQPTWDSLRVLPVPLLAKFAPILTAKAMRRFIENEPMEELRSRFEERRNLVFALEHVCRRKHGFFDAEAALFRLALAENETWGNNASGVWEHLFLAILAMTHVPFERRLKVLEGHFESDDSAVLRLASRGLSQAVGHEFTGPAFSQDDKVDGEWWVPTIAEAREGKLRAWTLLVHLIESKSLVRDNLCELAAQHLRSAIYYNIAEGVIELLSDTAQSWSASGKAQLREAISEVRDFEQVSDQLEHSLSSLWSVVAPSDYHARLLDVTANWSPAGHIKGNEDYETLRKRETELDEGVARDGLSGDPPILLDELAWLSSEAAVRAAPFMFHVGRLDTSLKLVDGVIATMAIGNAANSLSTYLAGVQEALGPETVDGLILRFKDNPECAWAVVLSVWRCGVNSTRAGWLVELMRLGTLNASSLNPLEHVSWSDVDTATLRLFVETLLAQASPTGDTIALNIAVSERNRLSGEQDLLADVLLRASRGPAKGTMDAYYWERAAELLLNEGKVELVIQAAALLVSSTERYAGDQEAWKIFGTLAESHGEAVWDALAPMLDKRDEKAFSVVMGLRSNRLMQRLPVSTILEWVGHSEDRACWAAMMCNVQSSELDEIVRQLLIRFGSDGDVADELAARAGSTDGVVSSIAGHARQQLDNAKRWAKDSEPYVAGWGNRMIKQLENSYDYHAAWEEFRDRQYH